MPATASHGTHKITVLLPCSFAVAASSGEGVPTSQATENNMVQKRYVVTNIRNGYADIEVAPSGNYSPIAEEVGLEDATMLASAPDLLELVLAVRDMMRDCGKRIPLEAREGVYKKANDLIAKSSPQGGR